MHAKSPPACVCACLFTAVRSEFLCVCRTDWLLALGSPSGELPEMDGVQIPSGVRPNYRRFESCRIPCGYIASGLVAAPVGSKPARARAGPKQKRSRSAAAGRLWPLSAAAMPAAPCLKPDTVLSEPEPGVRLPLRTRSTQGSSRAAGMNGCLSTTLQGGFHR